MKYTGQTVDLYVILYIFFGGGEKEINKWNLHGNLFRLLKLRTSTPLWTFHMSIFVYYLLSGLLYS